MGFEVSRLLRIRYGPIELPRDLRPGTSRRAEAALVGRLDDSGTDGMGLIEEINRTGYHVKEMRIVDDAGRRRAGFGTTVFGALTGGRYVTLPRSELSRLLFGTIAHATECIFDDEITHLREEADAMLVRLVLG